MKFDLNHLVDLAGKLDYKPDCQIHRDNLAGYLTSDRAIAIGEAFRALEQRAEAAEVEKAGAEERCRMMFDAKNHWADRARAAEAKLAELEKQEPMGRVDRGAVTDSNEYPDARVVCLHEHVGWEAFQDGTELFTRPTPAVSLAELMPAEKDRDMIAHVYLEETTADKPDAYVKGFNACRDAILRNIEEANK